MEGVFLALLFIPAVLWFRDFYRYTIAKLERVLVLRKNGTYDVLPHNTRGKKSITVDGLDRKIGAKSIFTGPMGNLIIIPETASEAIRADKLEVQSDIDPEDLNTIGKLSFFAGQISLMKNKLQAMQGQMLLIILVLSAFNLVLLFKMSNDMTTLQKTVENSFHALKNALTALGK